MKRRLIIYSAIIIVSFSSVEKDIFFSPDFVNLKGEKTLTIIKNSTTDTLHLTGEFFNGLPYVANAFKISIAPNNQDTLEFSFTYPDFIHFHKSKYFKIFNAPGKSLQCDILGITERTTKIDFHGELADINSYYLAHQNKMGIDYEQNRPYFIMGDMTKDFNNYPAVADSISQLSLDFLKKYDGQLPSWFKKHEEWRVKYASAFLKYNVLFTKEYYGGKKIMVNKDYYSFEKELPIENNEMILNGDYIWYLRSYIDNQARILKSRKEKRNKMLELFVADSLLKETVAGDIFKMDKISMFYIVGLKEKYDSLLTTTEFTDNSKKRILDSLVNINYGLPNIGKIVPKLSLTNLNGEKVLLNNYTGNYIIINFWATWCRPCIQEFPIENKLYKENKDKGLIVINICIDSELDKWKEVSKKNELETINLFTDKDEYQYICRLFGISGLPKSILLDKNLSVLDNNFKRASALTKGDVQNIIKR